MEAKSEKRKAKTLGVVLTILVMSTVWCQAQLTATVRPGYIFSAGERPTVDSLNQLGTPSIAISGTISGTVGLTAQSVTGTHLANSVVDGATTDFNGSTPRAIIVKNAGVGKTQLATNAFLRGISGGAGTSASVNVDTNSITIDGSNQLCIATGAAGYGLSRAESGTLSLTQFVCSNGVPASAGGFTNAHSLGAVPGYVRAVLVFTNSGSVTTSLGYQQGDEVELSQVWSFGGSFPEPGFMWGADSANVWVKENNNATLYVANRVTGAHTQFYANRTNWMVRVYARP